MAKQSGLHQIRGKVGEHSYYKQTGVYAGLIRSINQGMSARVKTSEEYANTRLNNAEFGAAANVAGLLGKMVTPKYRPMILPFSQSKLAKDILEIARQSGGSWGQRVVNALDTQALCDSLTSTSKLTLSDWVAADVDRTAGTTLRVDVSWTAQQATQISGLGIQGLSVSCGVYDLATGKYVAVEGGIHKSYFRVRGIEVIEGDVEVGTADTIYSDITIPESFSPTPELYYGHRIAVIVLMPYRTINSIKHVLQEYCSFIAVPVPDAE